MSIFAVSDLHLSGEPASKPMHVFSPAWLNHWDTLRANWRKVVSAGDTVLLCGDTSWASKLDEARFDLDSIAQLPGRKVLIRGNHDYWWGTVGRMTRETQGAFFFLHNNFYIAESWAVCGSRGWTAPSDPSFSPQDEEIFSRETTRIRTSLELARKAGRTRIILMLHFPPVCKLADQNEITALMEEFSVETCVYGHLHDESIRTAPEGNIKGTACHLVACDALNFSLKQIA